MKRKELRDALRKQSDAELGEELLEARRLTGSATLADTPGLIAEPPLSPGH